MNSVSEATAKVILDLYQEAAKYDRDSEEYTRLLETAAILYKEMNSNEKNEIELEIQKERNSIEDAKNECFIESEKLKNETLEKVERKKAKSGLIGSIITGVTTTLSVGATIFLGVLSAKEMKYRFDRATAKEQDEPIMTLTDRTTVQDGLRDRTKF